MIGDEVRLTLPGDPAYGRLVRIAALGLARRLGFDFRRLEDLGLAIDEAVILLLQPAVDHTPPARLDVVLRVVSGGIEVVAGAGEATGSTWPTAPSLDRFETLAGELVTSWALDPEDRSVRLTALR